MTYTKKSFACMLCLALVFSCMATASAAYGEARGESTIWQEFDLDDMNNYIAGTSETNEKTADSDKVQNIYSSAAIIRSSTGKTVSSAERTAHNRIWLSTQTDYIFNKPAEYFYTSGVHRIRYNDDSLSKTTSKSTRKKSGLESARSSDIDSLTKDSQLRERNRLELERQADALFNIDWDAYTFIPFDDLWIADDTFNADQDIMNSILADIGATLQVGDCFPFGVYYNEDDRLAFTIRRIQDDAEVEYAQYDFNLMRSTSSAQSADQSREIFLNDYQITELETRIV